MFSSYEVLFHRHLDRCERCREQVFNLCPEGARLLAKAAGLAPTPPKRTETDRKVSSSR